MKRSVKRSFRALELGLLVCACGTPTGVTGLVTAPMVATSPDAAVAPPVDAGGDAAIAYRRLDEPRCPQSESEARCVDPETEPLAWPYPPPFDHCKSVIGKGEARFSAEETTKHRRGQNDDQCCYLECGRYGGYGRGRP